MEYSSPRALEMAVKDVGDFVNFEFKSVGPIKGEDEYRAGYTVVFDAFIGPKRVQRVSVDLVADSVAIGEPDHMAPADRIDVRGVPACDYPVYPSARAVADKVCGIVERNGETPTKRSTRSLRPRRGRPRAHRRSRARSQSPKSCWTPFSRT